MCVVGSFPSSRVPKPTRPGIILRRLRMTGIPRKRRNKAEVVFCYILNLNRSYVLVSIYVMLCGSTYLL
jgi:hypothetical protein